jgi:D-arabinose 1-dehydrogenase-like Zn-dependent alcohol dehydrogenase
MSETDTDTSTTDAADLPKRVRKDVRQAVADSVETRERATVAEVVTDVAARFGVAEAAIKEELDALERNGFVYLVGDGSSAEVRLP